jgi:hypothetical protein
VKSASSPISNDEIKIQRDKRNTPESKLDKNGNALKYSRDIESDWVVKNDVPHYSLKEHTSVDEKNGFVFGHNDNTRINPLYKLPRLSCVGKLPQQEIHQKDTRG